MRSSIVCRRCQKLGRAVCACWLAGWAVVVPIKNVGLPRAHVAEAKMSTATTATSGSVISGSASLIHDQIVGSSRIGVWQDRQNERTQTASPSSSETSTTAGGGYQPPRTV
jgi:hypothetical protein